MKKPKAIQLYLDSAVQFDALSDAQAGRVIKALLRFANDEREEDFCDDAAAQVMFFGLKNTVKRDFEKYRRRCETNRRNAQMGAGAPIGNQNARKYDTEKFCPSENPAASQSDKTIETIQEKEEEKEKEEYEEKEKEEEKDNDQKREEIKKEQPENGCLSVLSLFHRICPDISCDKSDEMIGDERIRQARSALGNQSFESLFMKVRRSDFLSGRSGKWKGCTLSWVLAPENIGRILRGVYDNPRSSFSSGVTTTIDYSKHKSLFDD